MKQCTAQRQDMMGHRHSFFPVDITGLSHRALQFASNVVGMLIIVMACFLIACVVYTYTRLVLPTIAPQGTMLYYVLLGGICYISFGVWFHYLGALGTPPGATPTNIEEIYTTTTKTSNERNKNSSSDASSKHGTEVVVRLVSCSKCGLGKPLRAHHCSLCGECVLKMDHHCPWINGCVGYHNQRAFVLFLIYLMFGTFYCGTPMIYLWWNASNSLLYQKLTISLFFTFTLVLCAAIFVAMLGFVGWNMYLIATNQTSIEIQIFSLEASRMRNRGEGTFRNPYDMGGYWANILQVFQTGSNDDVFIRTTSKRIFFTSANGGMGLKKYFWQLVASVWLTLPTFHAMPHEGLLYPTFVTDMSEMV